MERNLALDLRIDPSNLDMEVIQQPALYAYYSDQLHQKRAALKHLKLDLEVFEAALDQKFRDIALAKDKKVTESQLSALIRQNPDWYARKKKLLETETAVEQMESVVWALVQKKDMLVTLASNMRQERHAFAVLGNGIQSGARG